MAPLPVIENTVRVTWNFATYAGVTPRIVQHFRTATSNMPDLGATIWDAAEDNIFSPMHSSFEPQSISLLPLDGVQATTVVANPYPSDSHLCNSSGQIIPAAAALMSWRTLVRGPKARGRSYIGPVCEQAVEDGNLIEPWRSDMEDAWAAMFTTLAGADPAVAFVVASYVHEESYIVASGLAESPLATQRRRQGQLR